MIEDDEGKSTVVPLPNNRDEITIGRKEGNTIRLTERNVSRQHARLVRTNNGFFIEDKGSYTGVRVNGDRISGRRHIKEGDEIAIGDYHLSIQLEKDAAKDASREAAKPAKTNGATNGHVAKGTSGTAIIKLPPERERQLRDAKDANPTDRARLCLISGSQAGKIFPIMRDEVMLGRTEENDIVLNHRSISRNHAKITVSGNTYQIVDLGSANGVRVNGEEYGKIDLRRGDKIDLGHVRLRFVGPGEVFAYDPSMKEDVAGEGDSVSGGGGGRGLVIVLVVLLLAGGGLAAAYFGGFLGGTGEPSTPPPAPSTLAVASAPTPPPAPLDDKAKELLAKAETAASAKKWDEALALAQEAKSQDKIEQYEKEKAATEALAECLKARDAGNLESAWAGCSVIDPKTQTAKDSADEIADVTTKLRDKIAKEARAGLSRRDKNGLANAKDKLDQLGNVLGNSHPDVAALRRDYLALDKELNPEKYAGQADDDGDGISNTNDDCPNEKGSKADKGCPPDPNKDSDGDGVKDSEDKCPRTAGDPNNSGCVAGAPPPAEKDSDGDGILDGLDKCPNDKTNACAAASGSQTYEDFIQAAKEAFATKDFQGALAAVDGALKKKPNDSESYRIRAMIHRNNGTPEKACVAMKKYISLVGGSDRNSADFTTYMDSQDITSSPACKR
jgi:pSer/pThr/pTyr-binding forkhead associated (FHA) protein